MNRLHIAVVVIAVIVVGAVVLGVVTLQVGVNTETQPIHNAGWYGVGFFPGNGGDTFGKGDELLDDDEYILSWSPTLEGQKVTMKAVQIDEPSFFALQSCIGDGWQYRVYIDNELIATIPTALEDKVLGFPGDAFAIELRQYQLRGRIAEGVLTVQYWLHCFLGDWVPLTEDKARLLSGIGTVNREKDQVQIGEQACFTWRTPYISDDQTGKGWAIDLYSEAQGRTVAQNSALADLTGRICYTTTTSDFTTDPTKLNAIRATLRNELWDKKFDVITSIDQAGTGPSLTITDFSPDSPKQGDTVTVKWDAEPNAETGLPIVKIHVEYGFGGIDASQDLGPDAREFSFIVGAAGDVRFIVWAVDSANRPSPTESVDISVGEPKGVLPGSFALLVILLFVILGALLGWKFGKGNWIIMLIVFLIFLGAGIIAAGPVSDAIQGAIG